MDWQSLIDQQLIGSGRVSQAAILSPDGVYTSGSDFQLTFEEHRAIEIAFENLDAVKANGLRMNGEKYFTLQANPRTIDLKKRADGGIVVKTPQLYLIAIYQAPLQHAETSPVVENLGDYLISQGY
ncbi:hypothetical protein FPOA_03547 [Fusarium poae]|uniref:Profilin n=1 Tax=Fusarium poae TaxID=36050 RepID=A0A1B8BA66_FUSPO|nr:hypothetical protein FPOA_03547 [Fusarium poae]